MATNRSILKAQQIGALVTTDVTDAQAAIASAHTRYYNFTKVGTENAATNVAETPMFTVRHAAKTSSIYWLSKTTATGNATDYAVITVSKGTAGAATVPVASWNTHTSAQGTITGNVPAALVVVSNADASLSTNDALFYTIRKVSATGVDVGLGTITVGIEEV